MQDTVPSPASSPRFLLTTRNISGSHSRSLISPIFVGIHELMESKGGKKKSSSSSLCYEAPLGYTIEDVRPNGGIKKFRSAAYSNCTRKPS
ncbi:hypothetical protein RDI58_006226 [Solanum bulbocastanum]|uniref:Uncharacterized protein n=1 Tax=Solanum bulbocastanum TaxID=147425 RepID=A0AAN8YRN8_SOLBU